MFRLSAALPLAVLLALGLAGCSGGSKPGPEKTVAEFYSRVAKFDTAGVAQLTCAFTRESFESDLTLLQTIVELGRLQSANVNRFSLEDFKLKLVIQGKKSAIVDVEGRLNAGPPIGSADLAGTVTLALDEHGEWCIIDSVAAKTSAGRIPGGQTKEYKGPNQCVIFQYPAVLEFEDSGCLEYQHQKQLAACDDAPSTNKIDLGGAGIFELSEILPRRTLPTRGIVTGVFRSSAELNVQLTLSNHGLGTLREHADCVRKNASYYTGGPLKESQIAGRDALCSDFDADGIGMGRVCFFQYKNAIYHTWWQSLWKLVGRTRRPLSTSSRPA
ncbi:MAG TPA: hypothetical protein VJB57_11800 [Dehalococcoidia bacterium]|nr:hypothetical protein [Dehalococcoidia bacterium]